MVVVSQIILPVFRGLQSSEEYHFPILFLILQVTVGVINVDYNTKLDIKESARSMTGTYRILAENPHGKDEAEVEITVLSSPSKPGGPLKVTDVTKNGCKLAWKKPEDDGGKMFHSVFWFEGIALLANYVIVKVSMPSLRSLFYYEWAKMDDLTMLANTSEGYVKLLYRQASDAIYRL